MMKSEKLMPYDSLYELVDVTVYHIGLFCYYLKTWNNVNSLCEKFSIRFF